MTVVVSVAAAVVPDAGELVAFSTQNQREAICHRDTTGGITQAKIHLHSLQRMPCKAFHSIKCIPGNNILRIQDVEALRSFDTGVCLELNERLCISL